MVFSTVQSMFIKHYFSTIFSGDMKEQVYKESSGTTDQLKNQHMVENYENQSRHSSQFLRMC
jgi:hypothetical protein